MGPIPSPSVVPLQQAQSPTDSNEEHIHSEAKRRKVRKGTRSCWECKRRKMKCIFNQHTSPTCNGCRRRGSKCISQEFPEDVSLSIEEMTHGSDAGVFIDEVLSGQSIDRSFRNKNSPARTPRMPRENGILTPASMNTEVSRTLDFFESSKTRSINNVATRGSPEPIRNQTAINTTTLQAKHGRLSRFLFESLPSREDTEKIFKASRHPSVLAHEVLTRPYAALEEQGLKTPGSLLNILDPSLHPILIATHMLQLAVFLQHLHPDLHEDIKGLSESPRAMMERMADLAISLVTTNEELLGSLEGLECIMIESMYQVNVGNLRRGWLANRRAMSIAQLMGLNRPDNRAQYKVLEPNTKHYPQTMWFRILFLDRHLCLMLGLSQGSTDHSIVSDAILTDETALGRLERIHCSIASRILERNESISNSHELTRALDMELQRAARSLPSKWWLVPTLDVASTNSHSSFWDMQRMFAQVLHYNLLNQLYLPYMLHSSTSEHKYEYSQTTCVNASREVLVRFNTLRNFNQIAYSCRIIDFLAIMAAMTLLLAHLDCHHSETPSPLVHQLYSDRAMIEQAQDNMKKINNLNADALSAQSADLLRRLLAIETETANGDPHGAARVSVQESGTETAPPEQNDDAVVSVHIPYFGTIKIARGGMSKEVSKPHASLTNKHVYQGELHTSVSRLGVSCGSQSVELMTPGDACSRDIEATSTLSQATPDTYAKFRAQPEEVLESTGVHDLPTNSSPSLQNCLSDTVWHNGEYPGLTAGGEDWAFQGVDMAFFDSLMRSTGGEGNEDGEWTTWQK